MKNKEYREAMDFEKNKMQDGLGAREAYFDELEAGLFEQLGLEEELFPNSRRDGFAGDPASFETMEDQILKELKAVKPENRNTSSVIHLVRKNWQIAAGILILLGLYGVFKINQTPAQEDVWVSTNYEGISETYVEQQIYFLSDAEMELLLEDEVLDLEGNLEIRDADLEEYLMINEAYNYN